MYIALHEEAAAAGREVEVGIVKDLFQFHPYRWYNVLDHLLAWLCDKLFNQVGDEDCCLEFYRCWCWWCRCATTSSTRWGKRIGVFEFVIGGGGGGIGVVAVVGVVVDVSSLEFAHPHTHAVLLISVTVRGICIFLPLLFVRSMYDAFRDAGDHGRRPRQLNQCGCPEVLHRDGKVFHLRHVTNQPTLQRRPRQQEQQ